MSFTDKHCFSYQQTFTSLSLQMKAITDAVVKPRSGKRRQGHPLITWRATCKKDLQTIGVDWDDAARVSSDRELGKMLVVRRDTD